MNLLLNEYRMYGQLARMLVELKPDVAIVSCPECDHGEYVVNVLDCDLDVISGKPLMVCRWKCDLKESLKIEVRIKNV